MRALILTFLALALPAHAAGTIFTTLLGDGYQSYASSVTSDAQGNTYVAGMTAAPDFPTTPGAFQPAYAGGYDAFVAKLGPDGKILWATYLGGSNQDWASGVALDNFGNVWVTGFTASRDFPLANPIQTWLPFTPGDYAYAFVSKLSPDGTKLPYSTLLGSTAGLAGTTANAAGIAVDSAGNAYAAVNVDEAIGYPGTQNAPEQGGIFVTKLAPQGTLIYSYFHPNGVASAIALDSSGDVYVAGSSGVPASSAIVFKVSPDGSTKLWENTIGASAQTSAAALAVDSAGEVWVAGRTSSANFPLINPLESTLAERPLWASTNFGATWAPIDNLPFALPQTMVVDPATPTTLYEGTADLGVFKSLDGGATWTAASSGIVLPAILALAIDPVHPQTLYASTSATVYKSTDGAATWTAVDSPPGQVTQLLVDAQNPNNIYEVTLCTAGDTGCVSGDSGPSNMRKSTDGGTTWNTVPAAAMGTVTNMALDPRVSGHAFVDTNEVAGCDMFGCNGAAGTYSSLNGGAAWTVIPAIYPVELPLLADPSTNPTTVYDGLNFRSVDGGVTWSAIAPLPGATTSGAAAFALDPSGSLYAWYAAGGMFVSHDHAQTWTPTASPGPAVGAITAAGTNGALYSVLGPEFFTAANQSSTGTAGFVSKISADGSKLLYSTYLRGHQSTEVISTAYLEPAFFTTQNWISGIALDPAGNVIVAGGTRAADFPAANPLQSANAGRADAFVAVISADGSKLNYSTYLGGSQDDGALAASIDPQGNVIFAGETWSGDFPITNGPTLAPGAGGAFVTKLTVPTTPVIASVLNGASFQPGIEAGSWVMITGSNLANTTRLWQAFDFTGNDLPVSLSGVSVTIDGEPAFVEYISPTQINVQAPSDSTTGAVAVVVNNNGILSAPAAAQLQTVAPAFFTNLGTSSVIATLLPNYTLVSSSTPANPGDLVVLWGTGFGPTTPLTLAGVEVRGTPATALPAVTVGGMPVTVLNSILTAGSAGLYQITIQLPANVPTGAVAIQASIGGAQTQSGATIFVGQL